MTTRDTAAEPRTAAGRALDQDLDEWSGLSNAWTRNILAIEAEAAAPALTAEALAEALHSIGGEFDDPFTPDHPAAMHNSQAAAILACLAPAAVGPALDVGPDRDSWVDGYRAAMAEHRPPAMPRRDAEAVFNRWFRAGRTIGALSDDPPDPEDR